jgi:hypothetical protein
VKAIKGVSIAVVLVMILSAAAIALPGTGSEPKDSWPKYDDNAVPTSEAVGRSEPIPESQSAPASGLSWTDGPLVDKITRDHDGSNWSGGKIVVSGRKVAGDIVVYLHDIFKAATLEVEVRNNEVGGNIVVNVVNNPFLLDLIVTVGGNRVGGDIQVSTSNNAVSNLKLGVSDNQACFDIEVRANSNIIDYTLIAGIRNNNASMYMIIELNNNRFPPNWDWLFHTMNVLIEKNHATRHDLKIYIMANRMAKIGSPQMNIDIKHNGAGVDLWVRILTNKADPGGIIDIDIMDNASDNRMEIMVYGNKANKVFADVMRNYGCVKSNPIVQLDSIGQVKDNTEKCMQNTPPDSDGDGLTNLYESMVGTDPAKKDTDDDGLIDGWDDKNKNMKFDIGERYGEIGDPGAGSKFAGSIASLVDPNHDANPLCADIYVEVDYLKGQKNLAKASATMVEDEFEDHRIKLHIDNGWRKKSGGGQKLPAKCDKHKGDKYFYFFTILGDMNDFYEFKQDSKYFDPLRKDIFHYAIIANYIAYEDRKTNKIVYDKKTMGIAELGGDDFMLSGKGIKNWVKNEPTFAKKNKKKNTVFTFAKTFMHELGHNLNLTDVKKKSDESKTVMYRYISALKPLDYKQPSEWAALKPDNVANPKDSD